MYGFIYRHVNVIYRCICLCLYQYPVLLVLLFNRFWNGEVWILQLCFFVFCLFESWREREGEWVRYSHPLIHSPDAGNSHVRAQPKPGTPARSPACMAGTRARAASAAAFPGAVVGSWVRGWVAGTQTGITGSSLIHCATMPACLSSYSR